MECLAINVAAKVLIFICFERDSCSPTPGHFARNCPTLNRDVCYLCGMRGHHGMDCPLIMRLFGGLAPMKRCVEEVCERCLISE